jgi:hypothetical protein
MTAAAMVLSVGEGFVDAVAAGVVVGAGVVVAADCATAGPVMLVMMLAVHVTADPPTFPLPLHWLTMIGIAPLTLELWSTVQCTVPPPPLPEPLHWVTMAPLTGPGSQPTTPKPPLPEPTHWVTVGAVRGRAPEVSRQMLLVILTLQVIGCAASLSELLHCRTAVTRLVELVVDVPFGVEQGPSVHSRVTVVVELVAVPLIVLTTVTVHLKAVVAPAVAGPWLLHWSTMFAAWAAVGAASPATQNALVSNIRAITIAGNVGRRTAAGAAILCAGIVSEVM